MICIAPSYRVINSHNSQISPIFPHDKESFLEFLNPDLVLGTNRLDDRLEDVKFI